MVRSITRAFSAAKFLSGLALALFTFIVIFTVSVVPIAFITFPITGLSAVAAMCGSDRLANLLQSMVRTAIEELTELDIPEQRFRISDRYSRAKFVLGAPVFAFVTAMATSSLIAFITAFKVLEKTSNAYSSLTSTFLNFIVPSAPNAAQSSEEDLDIAVANKPDFPKAKGMFEAYNSAKVSFGAIESENDEIFQLRAPSLDI